MIRIKKSGEFQRRFKERISNNQILIKQFKEALALFITDRQSETLKDHPLQMGMHHFRAFSINNTHRVVYRWKEPDEAIFLDIGTHSEVYYK